MLMLSCNELQRGYNINNLHVNESEVFRLKIFQVSCETADLGSFIAVE